MEFYSCAPNELAHYGVLGMKWGVHRSKSAKRKAAKTRKLKRDLKNARSEADAAKAELAKRAASNSHPDKKKVSEMTDDELAQAIKRIENENRYLSLTTPAPAQKQQMSKGKKFVSDIIESKGKQLAGEVAYYYAGSAINKLAGANVVNVKSSDNKKKDYKKYMNIAKQMNETDLDAAVKRLNLEKKFADLSSGVSPDEKKKDND